MGTGLECSSPDTLMPRTPTSRDLADFHETRSRLYEIVATSLTRAPTPPGLAAVRTRLADIRSSRQGYFEARDALNGVSDESVPLEFGRLFGGEHAVSLQCIRPSQIGIGASCLADLTTLAKLAHETASAISSGQIMRAVHQTEVQRTLLDTHATDCLRSLADALTQRADCPFYRSLGVLLHELLEEDVAVLTVSAP